MPALLFAIQLLEQLPALIAAGKDVTAMVQQGTTALKAQQTENRPPSDAEWAALNAQIKALRDELHSPQ